MGATYTTEKIRKDPGNRQYQIVTNTCIYVSTRYDYPVTYVSDRVNPTYSRIVWLYTYRNPCFSRHKTTSAFKPFRYVYLSNIHKQ